MENASKALLIAAAVLIVILLVAMGMKIFNSTGDVTDKSAQVGDAISSLGQSATDKIIQGGDFIKQENNNEPQTKKIQFKIDNKTFYAEKGMSWFEWVDSDYNTIGVYIYEEEMHCLALDGCELWYEINPERPIDPVSNYGPQENVKLIKSRSNLPV